MQKAAPRQPHRRHWRLVPEGPGWRDEGRLKFDVQMMARVLCSLVHAGAEARAQAAAARAEQAEARATAALDAAAEVRSQLQALLEQRGV